MPLISEVDSQFPAFCPSLLKYLLGLFYLCLFIRVQWKNASYDVVISNIFACERKIEKLLYSVSKETYIIIIHSLREGVI